MTVLELHPRVTVARGHAVTAGGRVGFLRVVCVPSRAPFAAPAAGRRRGVVQDQTGAVLPARPSSWSASSARASSSRSTTADGAGAFRFESVAPGQYELRASYEGLQAGVGTRARRHRGRRARRSSCSPSPA